MVVNELVDGVVVVDDGVAVDVVALHVGAFDVALKSVVVDVAAVHTACNNMDIEVN